MISHVGVTRNKSFGLTLGCTAPRIEEQLQDQGLKLDLEPLARTHLQRDLDEVNRLIVRKVLTQAEGHKARCRIFRVVQKHARPIPP